MHPDTHHGRGRGGGEAAVVMVETQLDLRLPPSPHTLDRQTDRHTGRQVDRKTGR